MIIKEAIKKNCKLIIILTLSVLIDSCSKTNLQPKPDKSKKIIYHSNYTLQYNEKYEQADWVFYVLTKDEVLNNNIDRTNNFKQDHLISTNSANREDYKYSGYDRGHLAPARDMAFSLEAMDESFYYSNISPQQPSFNRGIWRKLEIIVREWAINDESVYIVTGPILTEITNYIGKNNVGVPAYYYKIVLDYQKPVQKAIAFLLPNQKCTEPLTKYVISIDSLESITKIDFFYLIKDELEKELEKNVQLNLWTF